MVREDNEEGRRMAECEEGREGKDECASKTKAKMKTVLLAESHMLSSSPSLLLSSVPPSVSLSLCVYKCVCDYLCVIPVPAVKTNCFHITFKISKRYRPSSGINRFGPLIALLQIRVGRGHGEKSLASTHRSIVREIALILGAL